MNVEIVIMDSSQLAEKLEALAVTNRALNEANRRLEADMAHLRRQFNALADRYATTLVTLGVKNDNDRVCGD